MRARIDHDHVHAHGSDNRVFFSPDNDVARIGEFARETIGIAYRKGHNVGFSISGEPAAIANGKTLLNGLLENHARFKRKYRLYRGIPALFFARINAIDEKARPDQRITAVRKIDNRAAVRHVRSGNDNPFLRKIFQNGVEPFTLFLRKSVGQLAGGEMCVYAGYLDVLKTGHLLDERRGLGIERPHPAHTSIDIDMCTDYFTHLPCLFVEGRGKISGCNGGHEVIIDDIADLRLGDGAENENTLGYKMLPQFNRLFEARYGKYPDTAFFQMARHFNCAVAIGVCLDDRHDAHG